MKIVRIFNNNVVLAVDKNRNEKMILGRGIGFHKKVNDKIELDLVDKIYVLETKDDSRDFIELANNVPANHLILTKEIIEEAEQSLNIKFDNLLYIGLADHINFAITRAQNGGFLSNAMLWEIKKFYPREFELSLKVIEYIRQKIGVQLTEDEAGFIAIHFVSGQQSSSAITDSKSITKIMQDILNIIKFHYKIEFDEKSLNFTRFITHLRFFLNRIQENSSDEPSEEFLFEQVRNKYPDAYSCVLRIREYIKKMLSLNMNENEMLYFMLHIHRLTNREKSIKN